MRWEIEEEVRATQLTEPDPGTGPQNSLFVPSTMRTKVLTWLHTAKFSCHPGINRMLTLTKRHFWWPTLYQDVKKFVSACSICAQYKNTHRPPAGLLHPLPIPGRPWSHIALDFITGLPPSGGFLSSPQCLCLSPFEASVGFLPPLFPSQESEITVPSVQHHLQRCRRAWRQTREALFRNKEQNRRLADKHRTSAPQYVVGQKVWLSTRNIPLKEQSKKLAPRFIGPYPITKIINPTSVKLQLPSSTRIHPTFHVSQLKVFVESPLNPHPNLPPAPASLMTTLHTLFDES
ncbi:uncharacterized protein LOC106524420 [Austrofundulus limnaeus]|uniref:Gypsy retrotransposon integrase-like protein 1 n=1 Tax=Austrofundulus limnaeus TaxID=52670 RepID=A0A2I4C103_AUSLI|nr:PREDICTED: uncharacterized protein LOC106524420 [Austrofundulus limnaeus]